MAKKQKGMRKGKEGLRSSQTGEEQGYQKGLPQGEPPERKRKQESVDHPSGGERDDRGQAGQEGIENPDKGRARPTTMT